MRDLSSYLESPPVLIDLGASAWRVAGPRGVVELPVERGADGKLSAASRQKLSAELARISEKKHWHFKCRAIGALSGAGVLLRQVTIPSAVQADWLEVLTLQIEKEFPLSPDELAWGWRELGTNNGRRDILLAAVRRSVVEEYAAVLAAAGLQAEFTIAAVTRYGLCPRPEGLLAMVDIDAAGLAEICTFANDVPSHLRTLPASNVKAETLLANTTARVIYVSGAWPGVASLLPELAARADCRRLENPTGGETVALAGLKKALHEQKPLLRLQSHAPVNGPRQKWNLSLAPYRPLLTRAAILLAVVLAFPFVESLLFIPLVDHRLAQFQQQKKQFDSAVTPEKDFFLYLKQNQPPYLDALYIFAQASPPGMHIDSLTMNQQGDLSLKVDMQNAQQEMDFRSKLIDSGFFSTISVEEQSFIPAQRKLGVRMTLHWKPVGRPPIKLESPPADAQAANGPVKM